jgi:tetratricopeptide (TPR) repeat protein
MQMPDSSRLLRVAVFSGAVLLLATGGILAGIYASVDPALLRETVGESGFYRLLRDYDFKSKKYFEAGAVPARRELDSLDYDLGRMEKAAETVESWLSVLKRRRLLADSDPRFNKAYLQSARRAASAFPNSGPVTAVASAALIRSADFAATGDAEAEIRKALPLLESPPLASMRLGFHVLLGDFQTPAKAAAFLPPDLLTEAALSPELLSAVAVSEAEAVITDFVIINTLRSDMRDATTAVQAAAAVQSRLSADIRPPSLEFTRFAAEYYYDFGDLLRSAQLFSRLGDEAALGRQADALWLAGHPDLARNIWKMLTVSENRPLQNRSLYNLALTAPSRAEAEGLFSRLAGQNDTPESGDFNRQYGLIRYSRLFDSPKAREILETGKPAAAVPVGNNIPARNTVSTRNNASTRGNGSSGDDGSTGDDGSSRAEVPETEKPLADTLIDLEILKRQTETEELARAAAETWLLLDRYPRTEELYHWGAWFFNWQRNYPESAILLRNAARHNFSGRWTGTYSALQQIRDGNPGGAEEILAAFKNDDARYATWADVANLGRVLEARRAPTAALENYQRAVEMLIDGEEAGNDNDIRRKRQTASRIQFRIAQCLKTLARPAESRDALVYALELDPNNLNAKLELERL